jgi:hypothetical protein
MDSVSKKEKVTNLLLAEGICTPDTMMYRVTDTLIRWDTMGVVMLQIDTLYRNDTTFIIKNIYRDILQTITIHDTTITTVVDRSALEALRSINASLDIQVQAANKERSKWLWWIVGMAALIGGLLIIIIKK